MKKILIFAILLFCSLAFADWSDFIEPIEITNKTTDDILKVNSDGVWVNSSSIALSNITMADEGWIGLAVNKGRLVFNDEATDLLEFKDCEVDVDGDFTAGTVTSDAGVGGTTGTFSSLTATRVPYISTGGLFVDSANFTFHATNGITLTPGANSVSVNKFSDDGTLAGDSDDALVTEKAIKTYIDGAAGTVIWSRSGTTISPTNSGDDIDGTGGYLLDSQSITNLASKGAGYYYNGVDAFTNLDLLAAELVNTNNTKGTIVMTVTFHDFTEDNGKIWYFGDTNANERIGLYFPVTDYKLGGLCTVAGTGQWTFETNNTFAEDVELNIVLVQDGTEPVLYVNGVLEPITFSVTTDKTSWFHETTGIDNGRLALASYSSSPARNPINCTINYFDAWNYDWTADEAKDFYTNGNTPNKYIGADNTSQTSGTLTIGKTYRIVDWITDDDFTNIGGTNVDGNEFLATGTTPTKWTNSSVLIPIGNVAKYTGESVGHNTWSDLSGNNLFGTVDGATAINMDFQDDYVRQNNISSNTQILASSNVVPAGYMLVSMIALEDNSGEPVLDLGTTDGASDVFSQQTFTQNTLTTVDIGIVFSLTADTELWLTDDGAGAWASGNLSTVIFILERVQ